MTLNLHIKNVHLTLMPRIVSDRSEPLSATLDETAGAMPPPLDIRNPPRMIKLNAQLQPVADGAAEHVAVLLPDYGLIFDARMPKKADNWQHAKDLGAACDLPGTGWRLPERQELQLLIDPARHEPAINTDYFPHTPTNDWYWTATARASSPSVFAWDVNFLYGYVGYNGQGDSGFVRACRRVSPGQ